MRRKDALYFIFLSSFDVFLISDQAGSEREFFCLHYPRFMNWWQKRAS